MSASQEHERSIVFFDLDGTLLNDAKEINPSTREAIAELQKRGHIVAIATGRAPFFFEHVRRELNIDTYVSYNGSYVVHEGEVVFTNPLNEDALQKLTDLALKNKHAVVYMDHEDMRANVSGNDRVAESIGTLNIGALPKHDPLYYKDRFIYQSLLFCAEGEEELYEELFGSFDFVRWHPFSLDVLPAGGSKFKGIGRITEQLGIPPERQYAFGDALNDLEMLEGIPNSVAMGNGLPEAKAAARWTSRSNEEDGIAYGLKLAGLL
ncbi:Cof-type HAD-IIB family hydrolase [Saccharibacillus sp. CPCC 101409]|uniref:Cof-type HAD-IIB family hydrolase n=1 Tax=Saccharibacillus sp. CPCC 101409 TaxID=3058041 RepID=UPI002671AB43|nr:Cof-type HAD-IIB family hydrolase [Saccharibacillus sp. CPCC 101409]MDO3408242.1 Cof-type HAD-IIB family hydrolase [Saccharibacillus sp. CPCC 101409]